MTITKQVAETLAVGTELWHTEKRNADGSPYRCRVNGKAKTWKRVCASCYDPERDFRLPVKQGLRNCYYLNYYSGKDWVVADGRRCCGCYQLNEQCVCHLTKHNGEILSATAIALRGVAMGYNTHGQICNLTNAGGYSSDGMAVNSRLQALCGCAWPLAKPMLTRKKGHSDYSNRDNVWLYKITTAGIEYLAQQGVEVEPAYKPLKAELQRLHNHDAIGMTKLRKWCLWYLTAREQGISRAYAVKYAVYHTARGWDPSHKSMDNQMRMYGLQEAIAKRRAWTKGTKWRTTVQSAVGLARRICPDFTLAKLEQDPVSISNGALIGLPLDGYVARPGYSMHVYETIDCDTCELAYTNYRRVVGEHMSYAKWILYMFGHAAELLAWAYTPRARDLRLPGFGGFNVPRTIDQEYTTESGELLPYPIYVLGLMAHGYCLSPYWLRELCNNPRAMEYVVRYRDWFRQGTNMAMADEVIHAFMEQLVRDQRLQPPPMMAEHPEHLIARWREFRRERGHLLHGTPVTPVENYSWVRLPTVDTEHYTMTPVTTYTQLKNLGERLHNCMASYWSQVQRATTVFVVLYREYRGQTKAHAVANYNPDGSLGQLVETCNRKPSKITKSRFAEYQLQHIKAWVPEDELKRVELEAELAKAQAALTATE